MDTQKRDLISLVDSLTDASLHKEAIISLCQSSDELQNNAIQIRNQIVLNNSISIIVDYLYSPDETVGEKVADFLYWLACDDEGKTFVYQHTQQYEFNFFYSFCSFCCVFFIC